MYYGLTYVSMMTLQVLVKLGNVTLSQIKLEKRKKLRSGKRFLGMGFLNELRCVPALAAAQCTLKVL